MVSKLLLSLMVLVSLSIAGNAQAVSVEFSEVPLPSGTLLDGTTHYTPYGLSFGDQTFLFTDSRFIGAGVDDQGISTTGSSNSLMSIFFDAGAQTATLDWLSINSNDIFMEAYSPGGALLLVQSAVGLSGTTTGAFTFSGLGTIGRIDVHDGNGQVGVGRITFVSVPEPTTIGLGLLGLALVGVRRSRTS